jgi:lipopolysaccharide transport system permease protein
LRTRTNTFSLVWHKALAELKAESSRGYIGILWWVIEPILYMLAFYFVFAVGFRSGGPGFVPFLLCGIVPWKWFAASIQTGSNTIFANRGLITQVYFHKGLLVATSLTASSIKFAIILTLLLAFIILSGTALDYHILALIPIILIQFVLIASITAFAASIVPFLPEFKLIIENGLLIMFFTSGIFFDIRELPEEVQQILSFNPMVTIIDGYRDVLLNSTWPDTQALIVVLAEASIFMAWGVYRLNRYDRHFAKIIN